MTDTERRKIEKQRQSELKKELNPAQMETLIQLEQFGWELKFVRRKPFAPGIPVVFDSSRTKFAVLRDDGSLDENPGFNIRV